MWATFIVGSLFHLPSLLNSPQCIMQISLVSLIEKVTSGIPFRYVHLGGVYGRRADHIIYIRTGQSTDEFDSAMREITDALSFTSKNIQPDMAAFYINALTADIAAHDCYAIRPVRNGEAFVMATGHPGAELSRIGFPMPVPQDVLILCPDDLQTIYNKHHK